MKKFLLAACLLMSACSTTGTGSGEGFKASSLPAVQKGSAQVVLYRPSKLMPEVMNPDIEINGVETCEMSPNTYTVLNVPGGKVSIAADLHGRSANVFDVNSGKRYYVRIGLNMADALGAGLGGAVGQSMAGNKGPYVIRFTNAGDAASELSSASRVGCQ